MAASFLSKSCFILPLLAALLVIYLNHHQVNCKSLTAPRADQPMMMMADSSMARSVAMQASDGGPGMGLLNGYGKKKKKYGKKKKGYGKKKKGYGKKKKKYGY